MQHDVRLLAAARAIYRVQHPEGGSTLPLDQAERHRTGAFLEAIASPQAALAAFAAPAQPSLFDG